MNDVMQTNGSRLRTVGTWAGYGLFFFAALLVSLLLTFPNRQLKGYVEAQARAAGYPLRIGEMSMSGLGGVRLSDVDLTVPSKGRSAAARPGEPAPPPPEPMMLHFDELRLDVALMAALNNKLDLRFEVEVGEGRIEGGRARVEGKKIDVEIEGIDHISLDRLGLGAKALAFQNKLTGQLEGLVSGDVKIHWGGSHEDFRGQINLEVEDAVLRSPRLEVQGGLAMRDLNMGVFSAKVTIDELGKIAILKGQSARNKATAISLEGVDIFGSDLELVFEERSHISIPPGKQGMRGARMQIHFAFALPQPKVADAKTKVADASPSDRLKWSDLMKFAGDKLKPFQRSGYVGMTCTGPLSRPSCIPALPQVTVGTRRKARTDARARKKEGADSRAAEAEAEKKAAEAKKALEDGAQKVAQDKKAAEEAAAAERAVAEKAEAEKAEAEKAEAKKTLEEAAQKAEQEKKAAEAEKIELKTVEERRIEPPVPEPDDDPRRAEPREIPDNERLVPRKRARRPAPDDEDLEDDEQGDDNGAGGGAGRGGADEEGRDPSQRPRPPEDEPHDEHGEEGAEGPAPDPEE